MFIRRGLLDTTPWPMLLVLLLAAALRLLMLGSKSLWFDEGFSVARALAPLAAIWTEEWVRPESHPPLYYTLLHAWVAGQGTSETAVRLPSAFMSLLNVALLYALGLRLAGRRVALLAAALLTVSPLALWYGQEARMYVFVTGAALLYALLLTWDSSWALPLQAATLTAGLYLDYTMLPLWAGLSALWLLGWWQGGRARRPFLNWLLASLTAALLFLPWLSTFRRVLDSFYDIHIFEQLNRSLGLPILPPEGYLLVMLALALLLIPAALVLERLLARPRWLALLGIAFLLLIATLTLLAPLPRFYGLKRLLLLVWPYLLLLAAWFLVRLEARRAAVALLALSLAAALVTLAAVPKDDWRGAVALINGRAAAGAVVYFDPFWNDIMGRYYGLEVHARGQRAGATPDLDTGELWLIATRFPGDPLPSSATEAFLNENAELREAFPLFRLEVRRYAPRGAD